MTRPTPDVSFEDVARVVARESPAEEHEGIHELIRQIEARGTPRVVPACLQNVGGDMARPRNELGSASGCWRETISHAEHPNDRKKRFRIDTLADVEKRRPFEKDWAQYGEWLGPG